MSISAPRDNNRVPTLIGVSSVDGKTPVTVYVDPTTHRVLVDVGGGAGYVYIAYASDDQGTDFTLTFNESLDYIAVLSSADPILNPQASDFAGLWKNYKGEPGTDGTNGTDGTSFIWESAYVAETTYAPNDAVYYNGSSYMCKLASTGNLPTNTTYWDLMAQKGADGEGTGDVVGPASAVDSNFAAFDTITGKLIKDSGSKASDFAAALGDNDNYVTDDEKTAIGTIGNKANTDNPTFTTKITTPIALIGSDASLTDFPTAKVIASQADSAHSYTGNIGLVGEAVAAASDTGTGIGGIAVTNGANESRGVTGVGKVGATGDTAKANGVYGYVNGIHAGGDNIGVRGSAINGANNYSFYGENGKMYSSGDIELGHLTDTTLHRVSAGVVSIEGQNIITAATVPVKATGAELDTGTDDAKFATAKALADSSYAKTTDIPTAAAASDLNTGTDTSKFVTSDALAGSNLGIRYVSQVALGADTSLTVADGVGMDMLIPPALNGMNLVYAQAYVDTAGTTNATTIQIHNVTDNTDMLSTNISIASGEKVGTAGTVNASYNDVETNDLLRIDVDAISTTAPKGITIILGFSLP